jgi:DHA1 family multidrug resistance protein-like MFS transporter
VIAAAQFLTVVGFSCITSFIPYYIQELGVSDLDQVALWAGLVTSAPSIVMAFVSPIWGFMSDRYGRKIMLERAMFGASLCLGLCGLVRNVQQLVAIRVVQGGLTGSVSAATTLVASVTPREKAGYGLGLLQMAIYAGASFGPLVGGVIADNLGYRPVFGFTSVVLFLSGMCVLFVVSEDFEPAQDRSERGGGRIWGDVKATLRSTQLLGVIAVSIAVRLADSSVRPMLPIFVQILAPTEERIASVVGSMSAVSALVAGLTSVLAGRWGDKLGYRKILVSCTIGACLLLIPQAFVLQVWQLFLLRALVGACVGGTFPLVSAAIAAAVASERQGAAYGVHNSARAVGRALGPMLGAAVATMLGFRAVFLTAALLFALAAASVLALVSDRPTSERSPFRDAGREP